MFARRAEAASSSAYVYVRYVEAPERESRRAGVWYIDTSARSSGHVLAVSVRQSRRVRGRGWSFTEGPVEVAGFFAGAATVGMLRGRLVAWLLAFLVDGGWWLDSGFEIG